MKSAILLLGFNRIDYFAKVLASLEKNDAAHEHDLHVYVDGGPAAKQAEIKELIANSLNNFLKSRNLSRHSIAGFATVDFKKDE